MTTRKRTDSEEPQNKAVESPKKAKTEESESAPESGETLECRDCQKPFLFSEGEKEFYEKKGWTNKPTRCKPCSAANKIAREAPTGGVCYANQRGECDRGDKCRYSHDASAAGAGGAGGRQGGGRPQGVCYANQRGECNRGDQCRYSHEGGSSGGGGGGFRFSHEGGKKRGVCFDHQKGRCDRGDGCRFSHEAE